jgi:co-chaperonin GroES (HSP10)
MRKVFKPYGERIIVEKVTEKERGGLIVPQAAQKRALIGKVVATGPEAVETKPGEIVLFAQFSGCTPYMDADLKETYGDKDILVMNEEDILSWIENEPEVVTAGAEQKQEEPCQTK